MGQNESTLTNTHKIDINHDTLGYSIDLNPVAGSTIFKITSKRHSQKYYYCKILRSATKLANFESNLEVFQKTHHPHIIQFIGYDIVQDSTDFTYYLVVEPAQDNLQGFLTHSRSYFDHFENIILFVRQILSAVNHLHIYNATHGNINPKNILITRTNLYKLDLELPNPETPITTLKNPYLAPEWSSSSEVPSQKLDIYSLGLVILDVCGAIDTPSTFQVQSQSSLKEKIENAIKTIEDKHGDADLGKVLRRMLALNPLERPELHELKAEFPSVFELDPDPLQLQDLKGAERFERFRGATAVLSSNKDPKKYQRVRTISILENSAITKILYLGPKKFATCSTCVKVWDLNINQKEPIFEFRSEVFTGERANMILLSNGRIACSFGSLKAIKLLDAIPTLQLGGSVGLVEICNLETRQIERRLTGHEAAVIAMIELADNVLITGSMDATIRLWDLSKPSDEANFKVIHNKDQGPINSMILLDNDMLACSSEQYVNVYNIREGNEVVKKFGDKNDLILSHLMLLQDNCSVAAWAIDASGGKVKIFNWKSGKVVKVIEEKEVKMLVELKQYDGKIFLNGNRKQIDFWNKDSDKLVHTIETEDKNLHLTALELSPSGNGIITAVGSFKFSRSTKKGENSPDKAIRRKQFLSFYE